MATPTFATMPDSYVALPTLTDVGYLGIQDGDHHFAVYPEIDRVDRSSRSMRQKVESSRMCICESIESIESDRSMPSTSAQNDGAVE